MSQIIRPKIIIGNWKMNKSIEEIKTFITAFSKIPLDTYLNVGFAVPYTSIALAVTLAKESTILIGAQNMSDEEEGAFTGEISALMIKECGASFVLIGHSERRQLFFEKNESVNKKIKLALKYLIRPVLCVGETLEEFQSGATEAVLRDQLINGLKDLNPSEVKRIIVAYEPIWAIGTNKTATTEIVQSVHAYCRALLGQLFGKEVSDCVLIQYGGSVKPENSAVLLNQQDVDGLLVGASSLSLESFKEICRL